MIIGYDFGGDFNDSYMFDSDDPNLPTCEKCGYVSNFDYISPMFKLKKTIYDISYTYDGRVIVSEKFKDFCIRHNYEGLEFRKLPSDPFFYVFVINNIVEYDSEKKTLNYENLCDKCGNYESITPAYPIKLKSVDSPLKDGFYASNIHFASENEKNPLQIVGIETYKLMKKEKFKGVHFLAIEQ